MRVGVYIDGFNLYYGGLGHLGSSPGWKWIDLRALASRYASWQGAQVDRVVYCTARVNDAADPLQTQRQDFYLKALKLHGSVDVIEEGYYTSWAKESVMTVEPAGTKAPSALRDPQALLSWSAGLRIRRNAAGNVFATVRKREEKGSDVNVATHLLADVLQGRVDAAIVISNDSDLALPIRIAREHVPVGLINPQTKQLAGALKGLPTDGVGRHWWRRLNPVDLKQCQLPDPVAGIAKPSTW
ncbi:NYN domain-containing protein [Agromyces albus]|uniref:NYN domain-containing protein n=1 Tax=Agromyces albus TaxID=205332 RepID=A0A4Q2L378_9MICO|nr:NYN domain-containing protein [Agromyces albus]RXZ71897.1 NYN domain-containing protein [Agromyces albus]